MLENKYSLNKYIETFSTIRKVAEQHAYLWNKTIPPKKDLRYHKNCYR